MVIGLVVDNFGVALNNSSRIEYQKSRCAIQLTLPSGESYLNVLIVKVSLKNCLNITHSNIDLFHSIQIVLKSKTVKLIDSPESIRGQKWRNFRLNVSHENCHCRCGFVVRGFSVIHSAVESVPFQTIDPH